MKMYDWIQKSGRLEKIDECAAEYIDFLTAGKTERLCVKEIVKKAENKGFVEFNSVKKLEIGQKLYVNHKGKSVFLFVIGKKPLEEGLNIVGAHIDSPRLDLKGNPLYEDSNLALLKTHYYGGIKKYQWGCVPLALVGVVYTKDGKKVEIEIGLKDEDPVFCVNDLLIHLAAKQMQKKAAEVIEGEQLNIVFAHMPGEVKENAEKSEAVKQNVLKLLKDRYGIEEEDFISAEIEAVPVVKAKYVGIDKGLIGSYGQDDRICSFTAMRAILDVDAPERTACVILADKEEIGSVGNTGMNSLALENVVSELIDKEGEYSALKVRRALYNSKVLSSDVNAAFDPSFPDVMDKKNCSYIGQGIALTKYTGSRGKSGSNDANAEFMYEVRKIFNDADVLWQIGELGKVDEGGGGTIACYLSHYGAEVVDCGPAVLNMHSPFELSSKVDVYSAYMAYNAFLK